MENEHYEKSSFREMLVEHLFLGELLKALWLKGVHPVEVLKNQVDDSGYDLVIVCNSFMRHIQLKSSKKTAKTNSQGINLALAEKTKSGCVIWIQFDDSMKLGPFLWFGGAPGEPLGDISALPVSKHAKGNAQGIKTERLNHRDVSRGKFKKIDTIDGIIEHLFSL